VGVIMAGCSLFVFLFFLLKNLPLIIKKVWRQDKKEDEENAK
jgi:hypothetical protein